MLENYRKEIDEIDKQLLTLLAKRMLVVHKVWIYKKQHHIDAYQPSRWQEVLSSRKKLWKTLWLDEKFIEDIWNRIHQEALKIEN